MCCISNEGEIRIRIQGHPTIHLVTLFPLVSQFLVEFNDTESSHCGRRIPGVLGISG